MGAMTSTTLCYPLSTWTITNKGVFYDQIIISVLVPIAVKDDDVKSVRYTKPGSSRFYITDTESTVSKATTTLF